MSHGMLDQFEDFYLASLSSWMYDLIVNQKPMSVLTCRLFIILLKLAYLRKIILVNFAVKTCLKDGID